MSRSEGRNYFIVKHGLADFKLLPGVIWRTNKGKRTIPHRFSEIKLGDVWTEFAYTTGDGRERPLSIVTGFYECTKEAWYDLAPKRARDEYLELKYLWKKPGYAWMIKGKEYGKQPLCPVAVPPISDLLGRRVFTRQAITPGISAREFERIREKTLSLEFDTNTIPLLGRQPRCEQEVVSIIVAGYKELGIKKIIHVQTHFPDMLVNIGGKEVHLEIEVYSEGFWQHWDDLRPIPGVRDKRMARRRKDPDDDRPVAVLCWVDNDKKHAMTKSVKSLRVFELQSLLRTGEKIRF
ncbi:MAG: hypothetical protein ABIA59_08470 [Candidatus Latescibacterota bacterium]